MANEIAPSLISQASKGQGIIMKSVPHKLDHADYQRWISRVDSQRMLALQSNWLQNQISQLHGQHLLYHGVDSSKECLATSPARHKFRMGLPWQQGVVEADAWMNSRAWPLPDQSVDVVVMQHSLDFTRRPHQMIREATRVLAEDGHMVIIGFNPWSWWGALRTLLPFATHMPWVANIVGMKRLRDWLILLGYTVRDITTTGHVWPLTFLPARFSLRTDSVLAGSPLVMGSFYMIVAQKTTLSMWHFQSKNWGVLEPQLGWAANMGSRIKTKQKNTVNSTRVDS